MTNPIDLTSPRPIGCGPTDPEQDTESDDIPVAPGSPSASPPGGVWGPYGPSIKTSPATFDCREGADDYDFDHCGMVRVKDPILFRAASAPVGGVSIADVAQGQIGDCALIAVLAGLASMPEGRALLHDAVVENKDGNGSVISYTVTLHKPFYLATVRLFSREVKIDVPPEYPKDSHARALQDCGQRVVWPSVIERAYAQLSGGYNSIGHGGGATPALEALTGKPAEQIHLTKAPFLYRRIQQDLASGKLLFLTTPPPASNEPYAYGLHRFHVYWVKGLVEQGGHVFLRLHNPWNRDQPALVPLSEAKKWFVSVDVGSVK